VPVRYWWSGKWRWTKRVSRPDDLLLQEVVVTPGSLYSMNHMGLMWEAQAPPLRESWAHLQ